MTMAPSGLYSLAAWDPWQWWRRFAAARLFGNSIPGHTKKAPSVGFKLATDGIQFYVSPASHCQLGQDNVIHAPYHFRGCGTQAAFIIIYIIVVELLSFLGMVREAIVVVSKTFSFLVGNYAIHIQKKLGPILFREISFEIMYIRNCWSGLFAGFFWFSDLSRMSEDIDKHVLRKYEIVSKLGKGVLASSFYWICRSLTSFRLRRTE